MIKDTYYFNGLKAVNIESLPEEAWAIIAGGDGSAGDEITRLYTESAFFRRCVDLRAQAISTLPRDILRGKEPIDENDEPMLEGLNTLLQQIETALVVYGYAYLFKERNRVTTLDVRWLAPKSIKPEYDKANRLAGFKRILKNREIMLEVEDVIHFWTPALDVEVGPGHPVGKAAAIAAAVLEGTTLFSKGFFERGAVFPMLLSVEGNPPRAEMDKLSSWWKRLTRGVKDAWTTIAVQATVTPQIIGPPISEMAMKDLNEIQRENVATALGIPHSLVLSNASNFATAGQDYIGFYDLTINPEAQLIAEVINKQWLEPLGLELVFQPSRLEVFQQANLETADKVTALVAANVLDTNEAREILGYEAAEMAAEPEPIVMQLPIPQDEDMRAIDLEKWQRKSLSSLKAVNIGMVSFESDHISYSETQQIVNELSLCFSPAEIKAVFDDRINRH